MAAARLFNADDGATIFTNGILHGWKWSFGEVQPAVGPSG
jgi:hypothetical protein